MSACVCVNLCVCVFWCVAEIESCDQLHVISSEIVFANGNSFVLYANVSRISFNNGRKIYGH